MWAGISRDLTESLVASRYLLTLLCKTGTEFLTGTQESRCFTKMISRQAWGRCTRLGATVTQEPQPMEALPSLAHAFQGCQGANALLVGRKRPTEGVWESVITGMSTTGEPMRLGTNWPISAPA